MAVAENAGAKIGSTSQNLDDHNTVVSSQSNVPNNDLEKSKPIKSSSKDSTLNDQTLNSNHKFHNHHHQLDQEENPATGFAKIMMPKSGAAGGFVNGGADNQMVDNGDGFKSREMRDLVEMLSKLNPMAEEFVPPSLAAHSPNGNGNGFNLNQGYFGGANGFGFAINANSLNTNGQNTPRRVYICFFCSQIILFYFS